MANGGINLFVDVKKIMNFFKKLDFSTKTGKKGIMLPAEVVEYLVRNHRVKSAHPLVKPMAGGISSDIFLVDDGGEKFVIKRALAQLRSKDAWFADVSRNRVEREYIEYVSSFLPVAVPRILFNDDDGGFFAMEYFGSGYECWKDQLMAGKCEVSVVESIARSMASIHSHSWKSEECARQFATDANFYALRLESYLLTTGSRHPEFNHFFQGEARRIAATKLSLMHGDFTPKNILVGSGREVVLDAEPACYGDPIFDAASTLNHLLLKSLHFAPNAEPYLNLAVAFWTTYQREMGSRSEGLEDRLIHLLPMMLLARVDGKSPAEYLTDERKKNFIRNFARSELISPPVHFKDFLAEWRDKLPGLDCA